MVEGRAHGFSQGDELTVYKSKSTEDREKPIGVVVIDNFDDVSGSAKLKLLPNTPVFRLPKGSQSLPALLTKSNEAHLKVYVSQKDQSLMNRIRRLKGLNNVMIANQSAAHISISIDRSESEDRLCFEVVDPDVLRVNSKLKLKPRFAPNNDDDLQHILNGLAHYYWHLKRTSDSLPVTKEICASFFKLQDTFTGQPRFVQEEGSPNLCSTSNVIDIEIDEEALYGLEITKNSEKAVNLFPVLFYFDNTDFTISALFRNI